MVDVNVIFFSSVSFFNFFFFEFSLKMRSGSPVYEENLVYYCRWLLPTVWDRHSTLVQTTLICLY